MKKVLFTATVDSHILAFHLPYLEWFHEQGYEVHVATNGDEEIPYCDKKNQISFERSPFKLNNLRAIKQLRKVINEEHYDIIHTHTPMGSVVTRLAAKKARKNGTRVIYTAHGFHFYKGAPLKNWVIYYPIEKFMSRYTDDIITINKEDYNRAIKNFHCSVHYVPGVGIDENKFNVKLTEKGKKDFREKFGLSENDFVMIYVARLDENKNQGFLIDLMKKINNKYNNIHLLLVGPDEYNGKYHKQAIDVKNVHFLGFRKDISKLMQISNIAVSSSLREGLPVNILEAMFSGLPIIAIDARGVRDLIENEKNGFIIYNNDIDNFEEKVLLLYRNKSMISEFGKENLKLSKNFKLEDVIDLTCNIYKTK